ncbi:hypothetical protein DASC09_013070 [Saccharomycopsis crataegensis]|uniref:Uncharacterized protein n=1 Tax=Saccharomycopsis crataegensis TaxID=43959 RepID=A0AAV5QH76_9ASCO|nr:hypothetical protein DASC09_013070 [Saccharomycopsis crataegensis]
MGSSLEYFSNKVKYNITKLKIEIAHLIYSPGSDIKNIQKNKKKGEFLTSLRYDLNQEGSIDDNGSNNQVYDDSINDIFEPQIDASENDAFHNFSSVVESNNFMSLTEYSRNFQDHQAEATDCEQGSPENDSSNSTVIHFTQDPDNKSDNALGSEEKKMKDLVDNRKTFSRDFFIGFKRRKFHLVKIVPSPIMENNCETESSSQLGANNHGVSKTLPSAAVSRVNNQKDPSPTQFSISREVLHPRECILYGTKEEVNKENNEEFRSSENEGSLHAPRLSVGIYTSPKKNSEADGKQHGRKVLDVLDSGFVSEKISKKGGCDEKNTNGSDASRTTNLFKRKLPSKQNSSGNLASNVMASRSLNSLEYCKSIPRSHYSTKTIGSMRAAMHHEQMYDYSDLISGYAFDESSVESERIS